MSNPSDRVPAVTLYADKEEVESAFKKVAKAHICAICGKQFNLLNSMGQLECRQHPGYLQENGRWSCCGQKQYPINWVRNQPILRMYTTHNCQKFQAPYKLAPKVPGCQPCDHNTSDQPFTHKDAMPITDLSALLPELNKRYPFHLRAGFDQGVLRRCGTRKIVVPKKAAKVIYMDNDGEEQTYEKPDDSALGLNYEDEIESDSDDERPEGIEMQAFDKQGRQITTWK